MKRGGLCFVGSQRHEKANKQHVGNSYNSNVESHDIVYEDANHLSGCRMSQYLPYENLQFNNNIELTQILRTSDEHVTGYIYCRGRPSCPVELHQNWGISNCSRDPNTKYWWVNTIPTGNRCEHWKINMVFHWPNKLVPRPFDHKKICDTLQEPKIFSRARGSDNIETQGYIIQPEAMAKTVYWLQHREESKGMSWVRAVIFILMNNSVFGKYMEHVKNLMETKLTTKENLAVTYFSQDAFQGCPILMAYIW